MFNVLRQMIGRLIPLRLKIFHRALYNYHYGSEPELRLLRHLCDPDKAAVDVGAHMGIYTFFLKAHSSMCYAVEPISELREILRQSFGKSVTILPFALSDQSGRGTLRIPTINSRQDRGRATIDKENDLDNYTSIDIEIERKRVDDLDWPSIGFIKVDVEGHELAMLKGANALLIRDQPAVIVESEERHHPGSVHGLQDFMASLGYECFFFQNEQLHPFCTFKLEIHQSPSGIGDRGKIAGHTYINNFIFLHHPERYTGLAQYRLEP